MSRRRKREMIDGVTVEGIERCRPMEGVAGIGGARVHAIGQGDAIAVVDLDGAPILFVDYGGNQGNPFLDLTGDDLAGEVEARMPVPPNRLVMLTHWDLDHWCSAPKGRSARTAEWIVPRQVTSPAAAEFSRQLGNIKCIPDDLVEQPHCFRAANGDELWWEKIASAEADGRDEDCNKTGIAFSLVRRGWFGSGQAILLPGDAPFDKVGHYRLLREAGLTLTGLVAFHHGAMTHWTLATQALLRDWRPTRSAVTVVFSCGKDNSYDHPHLDKYQALFEDMEVRRTDEGAGDIDLRFA